MRPVVRSPWRPRPDPEFTRFALGRRLLYLHKELTPLAATVVSRLADLGSEGRGNRKSGFRLKLDAGAPELFVRQGRRGGLLRFFLTDLYFGAHPRPIRELEVATEARRRGIPLAEPMGAMVEWVAPVVYRGFFLTRAVAGMTLWEFIRTDDDPRVRTHVLEEAHHVIDMMHRRGIFHADLNLHNLFVTRSGESFAVIVLDFDKAKLFDRPLTAAMCRRNGERLLRSARKLDPHGRYLDSHALSILNVS
jgi:Lipopolysaccharide kinase (Kdo/WaaP) family